MLNEFEHVFFGCLISGKNIFRFTLVKNFKSTIQLLYSLCGFNSTCTLKINIKIFDDFLILCGRSARYFRTLKWIFRGEIKNFKELLHVEYAAIWTRLLTICLTSTARNVSVLGVILVPVRENTNQNNSKYEYLLGSEVFKVSPCFKY